MEARAERGLYVRIPYEELFFAGGGLLAWGCSDSQGTEPAGDRASRDIQESDFI